MMAITVAASLVSYLNSRTVGQNRGRIEMGQTRLFAASAAASIAIVVAIGLIWSVAVMSQWVPVASAEMRSAAVIEP